MDILLVSSKYMPEYSGSGFRAHNLYKRLLKRHNDLHVRVLCGSTESNDNLEYEYENIQVTRVACKKITTLSNSLLRKIEVAVNFHKERTATLSYLRALPRKPDLIHVFGKNYVTATVLDYARREKIPAIIELCNEMDTPFQFIPFLNRLVTSTAFPDSYKLVCISEMLKKMALENGIDMEHIWCRPNPVDEHRFKPVSPDLKMNLRRRLTKFDEKDLVIVYVAKFRPSKNHRFLIDVMRHLPDTFKLLLTGPLVTDGPDVDEHTANYKSIETAIDQLGLDSRVQLSYDFIDKIEEFYQMSDVYAFPTLQEALGTPMLEAISCAVPVVANNLTNVTDVWIENGKNGYLSSMDAEIFADNIKKACAIPEETLLNSAETLIKVAGTKVIDEEYLQMIRSCVGIE